MVKRLSPESICHTQPIPQQGRKELVERKHKKPSTNQFINKNLPVSILCMKILTGRVLLLLLFKQTFYLLEAHLPPAHLFLLSYYTIPKMHAPYPQYPNGASKVPHSDVRYEQLYLGGQAKSPYQNGVYPLPRKK